MNLESYNRILFHLRKTDWELAVALITSLSLPVFTRTYPNIQIELLQFSEHPKLALTAPFVSDGLDGSLGSPNGVESSDGYSRPKQNFLPLKEINIIYMPMHWIVTSKPCHTRPGEER